MNSIKCAGCGFVGWADGEFCKKCGAELRSHSAGGSYEAGLSGSSPRKLKQGLAIAGLVIGILNFFTFGLLGVGLILGVTLSIVALSKAKRYPSEYGGQGLATAGLITSVLSIVMIVPIGIIAAIAIPNLLAARSAANEGSAISSMRKILSAEATYQATRGQGHYGSLDELAADGLIVPDLAAGMQHGYKFRVGVSLSNSQGQPGFEAVGVPLTYPSTGRRSFFIDESGVIRGADAHGAEATDLDIPLDFDNESSSDSPAARSNDRRNRY